MYGLVGDSLKDNPAACNRLVQKRLEESFSADETVNASMRTYMRDQMACGPYKTLGYGAWMMHIYGIDCVRSGGPGLDEDGAGPAAEQLGNGSLRPGLPAGRLLNTSVSGWPLVGIAATLRWRCRGAAAAAGLRG